MFLIFVAAGLLSGAFRALHEAGVWNIGQTVIADFSHILHDDSPLGVVLGGFFRLHRPSHRKRRGVVFRLPHTGIVLVFARQPCRIFFPVK